MTDWIAHMDYGSSCIVSRYLNLTLCSKEFSNLDNFTVVAIPFGLIQSDFHME